MNRYHLELTGHLLPGADAQQAAAVLAKLLGTTPDKAGNLLEGRVHRFRNPLVAERAEHLRRGLERAGIGCRLEPIFVALAPAAQAFTKASNLQLTTPGFSCPKCGQAQPPSDICQFCGIVFDKYEAAERRRQSVAGGDPIAVAPAETFPFRLVSQLMLLVFLTSLAIALWSNWRKDQFPPAEFYDLGRLQEPRQSKTELEPFHVEAEGIRYLIEPLFDYELDGVVVSLHDSDAFIDVYHFKDWKDFLNIRDLCVVWGENVSSGVFRDMDYKNTTWTCWISTRDPRAAASFDWRQLSNNHLLAHESDLYKAIKEAEIGDQIAFSGQLARYSHDGGFHRGTSTSRTDTGNGACETVYVQDFRIVRKSNPGWRRAHRLSSALAVLALAALAVLFVVSPYRPHR
ncbi:hypothetical protein Thiowin_01351 [Thiorhodovibrio winogradskyi]|uniref:Zinc ribbon domain-containing protein n=1 Tax=Thiorhodovibrio winogradskyi TaxID=77007 RepID=A0ABZ0S607_9GAMM|nr:hypothetical protein [Thiorhodovibrio winogradskyi]